MPSLSNLAVFAVAALTLFVIPGPSVLYIVTRSVEQGRRAGLVSVLGIHTGSLVHIAAATAGLSALLATSAAAFTVVKLAGAAYLLVLGVRQLRSRPSHAADDDAVAAARHAVPLRRVYAQGVVVNVLNPKTALFFLAFLPQFVHPGHGPAWVQIAVLGVVFVLLGMCSDSTYALVAGTLGARLRARPTIARLRDRVAGSIYVTLGVVAARARRAAV